MKKPEEFFMVWLSSATRGPEKFFRFLNLEKRNSKLHQLFSEWHTHHFCLGF